MDEGDAAHRGRELRFPEGLRHQWRVAVNGLLGFCRELRGASNQAQRKYPDS